MRIVRPLAVFLALFAGATGCFGEEVDVTVESVGTYTVTDSKSKTIDAPRAAAGKTSFVRDTKFVTLTDQIPLVIGTRFGIGYIVSGREAGTKVPLRRIWRFPAPGVLNPTTGVHHLMEEGFTTCYVGGTCVAGWRLNAAEEPPAGKWEVELWDGSRRLAHQAFQLTEKSPVKTIK